MRAGIVAAVVAVFAVGGSSAWAACPPGKLRNCVDLDLVPQISQQIVASERVATPPKAAPASEVKPVYTGPTVGAAANLRRAPTVGYRWSLE